MNEDTLRQRIELERAQATRDRSEFMRWVLLLAMNINRPTHSTLRFLLQVVRGEYADATELQVRRELDYLETRDLVKVFTDPLGQVSSFAVWVDSATETPPTIFASCACVPVRLTRNRNKSSFSS